jgi:hypothetical protein
VDPDLLERPGSRQGFHAEDPAERTFESLTAKMVSERSQLHVTVSFGGEVQYSLDTTMSVTTIYRGRNYQLPTYPG